MADFNVDRGMKRKKKPGQLGLAPAATAPKFPSQQDGQSGGIGGHSISNTLEIGTEFQLDLHNEDLVVLKELGFGNGGTVSKVQHAATKVIMAKKVRHSYLNEHDPKRTKWLTFSTHLGNTCSTGR